MDDGGGGHGFADAGDVGDQVGGHGETGRVRVGTGLAAVDGTHGADAAVIADDVACQRVTDVSGEFGFGDTALRVARGDVSGGVRDHGGDKALAGATTLISGGGHYARAVIFGLGESVGTVESVVPPPARTAARTTFEDRVETSASGGWSEIDQSSFVRGDRVADGLRGFVEVPPPAFVVGAGIRDHDAGVESLAVGCVGLERGKAGVVGFSEVGDVGG